jgi:hypothetical protein
VPLHFDLHENDAKAAAGRAYEKKLTKGLGSML